MTHTESGVKRLSLLLGTGWGTSLKAEIMFFGKPSLVHALEESTTEYSKGCHCFVLAFL